MKAIHSHREAPIGHSSAFENHPTRGTHISRATHAGEPRKRSGEGRRSPFNMNGDIAERSSSMISIYQTASTRRRGIEILA